MQGTTQVIGLGLVSIAVFAVPAAIAWMDQRRRLETENVQDWKDRENMPSELRWASLFMNEQTIRMERPVRLVGRVDQVYRTQDDLLVPVDTKTRTQHRVYDSDIVQVSAYAMILRSDPTLRVANHGYVRTVVFDEQNKKTIRYHRVRLLSSAQVSKLTSNV